MILNSFQEIQAITLIGDGLPQNALRLALALHALDLGEGYDETLEQQYLATHRRFIEMYGTNGNPHLVRLEDKLYRLNCLDNGFSYQEIDVGNLQATG